MSYYIDFESFRNVIGKAESFILHVTTNQGIITSSSGIPIIAFDDVMTEIELAINENSGFSIWWQGNGEGKIISFVSTSIMKIEIQFY